MSNKSKIGRYIPGDKAGVQTTAAPQAPLIPVAVEQLGKRISVLSESLVRLEGHLISVISEVPAESLKLKSVDAVRLSTQLILLQENVEMLIDFVNGLESKLEI